MWRQSSCGPGHELLVVFHDRFIQAVCISSLGCGDLGWTIGQEQRSETVAVLRGANCLRLEQSVLL